VTLLERLAYWSDPDMYDEPPTPEEALRQFLYVAIAHYIEEHDQELFDWLCGDEPEPPRLSAWVNEYAARDLSEPDGYGRSAVGSAVGEPPTE
jgi:hypothetical protein